MEDGQAIYQDDLISEYMNDNSTAQCKLIYKLMKEQSIDFRGALKKLYN